MTSDDNIKEALEKGNMFDAMFDRIIASRVPQSRHQEFLTHFKSLVDKQLKSMNIEEMDKFVQAAFVELAK